ncbi:MAG: hypothetical protein ACYC6L_08090 [Anaerolineae bacterium]
MPVKRGRAGTSKSTSFAKPRKPSARTGHKSGGTHKVAPPEERKIRIPVVGGGGPVRPKRKRNPGGAKIPGCGTLMVMLALAALCLAIVF